MKNRNMLQKTRMRKILILISTIVFIWGIDALLKASDCMGLVSICFEAEDSEDIKKPIKITEPEDKENISGKKCLEVYQGAGEGSKVGGECSYKFTLSEDGEYILWARVWWFDSCGNSFSVSFNKGPAFVFGNDRTYKNWHWVKSVMKLKLKKGTNSITIKNREDGIKIDQFLITNDDQLIPGGIEESTKLEK